MKTKFEINDEIYASNEYADNGYSLLGKVETIKITKYDYTQMRRWLKGDYQEGDLVEFVYFRGHQSGEIQEVEATQVFKTKEEAIAATIAEKEMELEKTKEGLAEDEAEIERLKGLL